MIAATTKFSRRVFLKSAAATFVASGLGFPAIAAEDRLTFLAIGDWGDGGSKAQRLNASAMTSVAREVSPRFVISLGDNFYDEGVASVTDRQWDIDFESVYDEPSLRCPWYAVLGNHDHLGSIDAEIAYSRIDPRWRMPAAYYRHSERLRDRTEVEFFYLDTTPIVKGENVEEQLIWLEGSLAKSTAAWKVVVGHHPVFSSGTHGPEARLIEQIKPLLERFRVQLYLNGHDHDLEHMTVDGVHYVTCGAGAKVRPVRSTAGSEFVATKLGFLTAMIMPESIAIIFVGADGALLHKVSIPVAA